jgi:hypothetical protein
MTMTPLMSRLFSAVRMASTATWSAFFSWPRPTSFQAAVAAASVTRTASSSSVRSKLLLAIVLALSPGRCAAGLLLIG